MQKCVELLGIVLCLLMRDAKHSVGIIVSGVEVGTLDSVRQIVHLVPRDVLNSVGGPTLIHCHPNSTHHIRGLHRSATGLQV